MNFLAKYERKVQKPKRVFGVPQDQVGGWVGGLRGVGFGWPALAAHKKPRPP